MSASSDYPNQYNTYGPPPVPPPPSKKSRRGAIIAVVAAVVALLIGVGIGGASKTTDTPTAASGAGSTATVTEQGAAGEGATVTTTVDKTVTATETVMPKPVVKTVEKTVTAKPPAPRTVTETAEPDEPSTDPNGPKANGKYLIGSQVSGGTWQCAEAETIGGDNLETAYWSVNAKDNEIIDNGIDTIAIVDGSGYTLELNGCATTWTKVG